MIHYMNLCATPFEKIKSGAKTIELRLYDEKRRKISIGDEIVFDSPSGEIMRARVEKLHVFASFEELYENLPLTKCGYTREEASKTSFIDMYEYYTPEMEKKYGVVGIELTLKDELHC